MSNAARSAYTLRQIVDRFGGEVLGDPGVPVRQVATLEHATSDAIAFFANERYLAQLKATAAGAVIVDSAAREATAIPRIVCENPRAYFARVAALLHPEREPLPGVHAMAVVHPSATVGKGTEVGPFVVVESGARIGARCIVGAGCYIGEDAAIEDDCRLFPNVTIYGRSVLGKRVRVHSGAVIGADGFGYAVEAGRGVKIPHVGRAIIGDDVEIGANTTIDRGTIEDTVIEEGVKLDNQIQIAHNVHIGAHTAIAGCAGVAGSARIGRHCIIGGASGIRGGIEIADHVEVSAHTIITRSIDKPGTYTGAYPFEANRDWRRNAAELRHLHELARRVGALEASSGTGKRSGS